MFKKFAMAVFILLALLTAAGMTINRHVKIEGSKYIVDPQDCPESQAAIVPGAYVSPDGELCEMLVDRIETAVELYKNHRVKKIIMTGDHGRKEYDEVNSMRTYAEKLGVPARDIFMDHAGFSTYESMYRAKEIFLVNSAVVSTQNFHLPRAVYTARSLGIEAVGVRADRNIYAGAAYYDLREIPSRIKAFTQVQLHSKPRFLGEVIPVGGDGRITHDGK